MTGAWLGRWAPWWLNPPVGSAAMHHVAAACGVGAVCCTKLQGGCDSGFKSRTLGWVGAAWEGLRMLVGPQVA